MRLTIRAALLAALATAAACGDASDVARIVRLVHDPGIAREGAFLAWGAPVTLGGETRPVLSTVEPLVPAVEPVPGPNPGVGHLAVVLPGTLKAVPWLVLETVVTRDGATTTMRSWPVTSGVAGTRYEVAVVAERVGSGRAGIRLWPCPDLAARDVETGVVVVPARAEFRTAVGVEPITLESMVVPLAMTVAVVAGGDETVLRTVTIDRTGARRGWTEVTAPLDAFAGRPVRLRFRARPTIGPTAVAVLPLWADPTIVGGSGLAPASR